MLRYSDVTLCNYVTLKKNIHVMLSVNTHIDPCIDGIMNYDETDIDCGGPLCPSCELGEVYISSIDRNRPILYIPCTCRYVVVMMTVAQQYV